MERVARGHLLVGRLAISRVVRDSLLAEHCRTKNTMKYWLLKTEPGTYSYADLARDKRTVWSGVTNNLALQNMRLMKKGDYALVYHSGKEKAIVGIAELASNPYPDPGQQDPKRVVVDIKAREPLQRHVALSEIKRGKEFASFDLVRNSRLSVMPVQTEVWKSLMHLAGHA